MNELRQQSEERSPPRQPGPSPSRISENVGVSKNLSGNIDSKTLIWGITPEQLQGLFKNTLEALHTMPSGVDGPNEIATDAREADSRKAAEGIVSPLAQHFDACARDVPVGIDTTSKSIVFNSPVTSNVD